MTDEAVNPQVRKATLERKLSDRPGKQELVQNNILHEDGGAPAIAAKQAELARNRLSDALDRKLQIRPDEQELVEANILKEDPDATDKAKAHLERHLGDLRPTKEELEDKNILHEGSSNAHPTLQNARDALKRAQKATQLEGALKNRPSPDKVEKIVNAKSELEEKEKKKAAAYGGSSLLAVQQQMQKNHEEQQIKTFTKWMNSRFHPGSLAVTDISKDLCDGVRLIALLENLSQKSLGKFQKKPHLDVQRIENINIALKFIADSGVKLVNISAEDIIKGNLKLILGLIWTIILRFQIQDISVGELTAKEGLLLWCQRSTRGYDGVDVQDFGGSFQDGLAFCALIHKYRPGLMDWDSLSKSNKNGNLELAFDTAEKYLNIPRLLDVEDFAVRPDERSVMTYVAEYFHCFSKSETADVAGKRIVKLVKLTEANDAMKTEYNKRAREQREWLEGKLKQYDGQNLGMSVEEVSANIDGFHKYKVSERHQHLLEQRTLEKLIHSLDLKLRADKRPAFTPDSGLALADLDGLWAKLNSAEATYADSLRKELAKWRRIDNTVKNFEMLCARVEAFVKDNEAYLNDTTYGDIPGAVQRKIRIHDAFKAALQSNVKRVSTIQEASKAISESGHSRGEEIAFKAREVATLVNNSTVQSNNKSQALEETLARLQKLEDLGVEYAKKANELNLWLDGAEEFLSKPILVDSVASAQAVKTEYDSYLSANRSKLGELDKLVELGESIRKDGGSETTFTQLNVEYFKAKSTALTKLFDASLQDVHAELSHQQENDALAQEYVKKATEVQSFINDKLNATKRGSTAGNEQAALDALKPIAADLAANKKNLTALEEISGKIPTFVAPEGLSYETLAGKQDEAEHVLEEKKKTLDYQITKKKMSGLSESQLSELKQCFNHFDKDASGALSRDEFKACLRSLGQDVTDEEVTKIFERADTDGNETISFEEFAQFMTKRVTQSDSKDDVLAAFKLLADNKPFITESELRSGGILDDYYVDYLMKEMPNTDKGYDYAKYVEAAFSR